MTQDYGVQETERRAAVLKAFNHPFSSTDIRQPDSIRTSVKPTEQDLHKVLISTFS